MTSYATCRHAFENERPITDSRGLRAIDLTQPKTYQCRRYPPQFVLTQAGSVPSWPNMLAEHWCGEYQMDESRVVVGRDRAAGAVNFVEQGAR